MESENEQMKKAEIEQMKKEISDLNRLNSELRKELEEVKKRSDARFKMLLWGQNYLDHQHWDYVEMKGNPFIDF